MKNPTLRSIPGLSRGFGLVEILVGLVIGMLVTLVIMQIMTNFEGQKRSTSGNADAQSNGNIALFSVQRGIQFAGFGLPVFSGEYRPLSCNPAVTLDHDSNPGTAPISMFPITVVEGGAGAPDSIIIRSGDPANTPAESLGGIPLILTQATQASSTLGVKNNLACRVGDMLVSTQLTSSGSPRCLTARVTALTGGTQMTIGSIVGVAGYTYPTINDGVMCLPNWTETMFAIDNNRLMQGPPAGPGVPIVNDIVDMQIQYGVATALANQNVANWVDAPVPDSRLIRAVRIALVARNGVLEKDAVSETCTGGGAGAKVCAWGGAVPVNITGSPDYAHYRYRVFETVVPLRNLLLNIGKL